jgi:hypothetical protein
MDMTYERREMFVYQGLGCILLDYSRTTMYDNDDAPPK